VYVDRPHLKRSPSAARRAPFGRPASRYLPTGPVRHTLARPVVRPRHQLFASALAVRLAHHLVDSDSSWSGWFTDTSFDALRRHPRCALLAAGRQHAPGPGQRACSSPCGPRELALWRPLLDGSPLGGPVLGTASGRRWSSPDAPCRTSVRLGDAGPRVRAVRGEPITAVIELLLPTLLGPARLGGPGPSPPASALAPWREALTVRKVRTSLPSRTATDPSRGAGCPPTPSGRSSGATTATTAGRRRLR